jgi:hypothetical protein
MYYAPTADFRYGQLAAERLLCSRRQWEPNMPRYFMHLIDSVDETLDPEGVELPAEAVPGAALMAARDCIAGDVSTGRIDLHCRIDVHDESGKLVHSLPFAEAVQIVQPR